MCMPRPILIAGPTASGKSDLALSLAQQLDGVVVNADALQVYDCWQVLTARPDAADMAHAPHRLYGHVPYDQAYSVGQWLRDVAQLMASETRRLIVVGGTGLYLSSLTRGLADIPAIPAEVRAEGDAIRRGDNGIAEFVDYLARHDPDILARVDRRNPMRLQRAWEVRRATGTPLSQWQQATPDPLAADAVRVVLDSDPDWLGARIDRRFEMMLETGALDEVARVQPRWDPDLPASRALGATQLIAHLNGNLSRDDAIAQATTATRQFAKRQRTWFRSNMKDWTRLRWDQIDRSAAEQDLLSAL